MSKKPKEMERELLKDGWVVKDQVGSHRQYVHPVKKGKVTIPFHSRELTKVQEKSIRKQPITRMSIFMNCGPSCTPVMA